MLRLGAGQFPRRSAYDVQLSEVVGLNEGSIGIFGRSPVHAQTFWATYPVYALRSFEVSLVVVVQRFCASAPGEFRGECIEALCFQALVIVGGALLASRNSVSVCLGLAAAKLCQYSSRSSWMGREVNAQDRPTVFCGHIHTERGSYQRPH